MIDVMTTAMRRPELYQQTIDSFVTKLFKDEPLRIIINVDPAGDDVASLEVVEVAQQYAKEVVYRCPAECSFPKALKWCWGQATSEFCFNLEDDWLLQQPVDLQAMKHLFETIPKLGMLRLSKWVPDEQKVGWCKAWNKWLPWTGQFYEPPSELHGLCAMTGHPTFLRGEFVRKVAPLLDDVHNPERQFRHNPAVNAEVFRWRSGVVCGPEPIRTVIDIGEAWRKERGWLKEEPKAWMTKWVRKSE
jgi:hypothetical protein